MLEDFYYSSYILTVDNAEEKAIEAQQARSKEKESDDVSYAGSRHGEGIEIPGPEL